MDKLLLALLESLEAIAIEHEEIYDTDCREAMREVVHNLFLNPAPTYRWGSDFGLSGEQANLAVREALSQYIEGANRQASQLGLDFQARLAAFQDLSVSTPKHRNNYDDFFGHVPSEKFDNAGTYIG